jgi:hypothetical protein
MDLHPYDTKRHDTTRHDTPQTKCMQHKRGLLDFYALASWKTQ